MPQSNIGTRFGFGTAYELNPEDDLRAVCPNYHAILHRRRDVLSIGELRSILVDQTAARSATWPSILALVFSDAQ